MKKIIITSSNKRIAFSVLVVVMLCSIISGSIFAAQGNSSELAVKAVTAEQALQLYINTMKSADLASLSNKEVTQKIRIEEDFGIGSWDKVEYQSISGVAPLVREVLQITDTGMEISNQEYASLLQTHVDKICNKYNFNSAYLSLQGNELVTKLTPEEVVNRNFILKEINQSSPVRIATEAAVPYQYYALTFNGQEISKDAKKGNYRIVFVNQDDQWTCYNLYADDVGEPENDY